MQHGIKCVIPWPFNPYIPVSCKLRIWGGIEFHRRSIRVRREWLPTRDYKGHPPHYINMSMKLAFETPPSWWWA